ncbi:EamA-like transporter family protein [Yoonia tamlensis]|uniref:EamA-like transporter family protein n=1 Tax=Yoonia tamlensis TaxID=390270 RepID=A0A1I6HYC0_9RHOB|nr:DMT family transporter [Yoonia tamlensis]SFR59394.1 EamA-like transporter family protein [Yoonia tamlensis]
MQEHQTEKQRANLIGSLWMIGAMACFAIEDVLFKAASQSVPIGQLLIVFGGGGACAFLAVALWTRTPLISADVLSPAMRVRVLFEIIGRLFFALALALTPLSATTVILQATPLVVVAGAAIVFGETVGPRRWIAIFVGLLGVVVIVQPGSDGFSASSILAIIGMFGFAGRDLASRAAPKTLGTAALGFYGFLSLLTAGLAYAVYEAAPFVAITAANAATLVGLALVGAIAYAGLMKAMRTGDVSAVTPFRYVRLLFGIACGVVFFGETITTAMLVGSALIVLSGLVIVWRTRAAKTQKGTH